MDIVSKLLLSDFVPESPSPRGVPRNPVDHWSSAILLERAGYLRKLAAYGDGSATETLKEHPSHLTMLCFRSRDGIAESHENVTDFLHILDGRATLVTGGMMVGAKTIGPGETQGDMIEGGARQELRAGDMVHIPAGVPHQIMVAGEKTVTYLVVKIKETQSSNKGEI